MARYRDRESNCKGRDKGSNRFLKVIRGRTREGERGGDNEEEEENRRER